MMSSQAERPVYNENLQNALNAPKINAREIEVAMLERAGIDPSKVRVEYNPEIRDNGSAGFDPLDSMTKEQISNQVAAQIKRLPYDIFIPSKFLVTCPPIINNDGTVDPIAIVILAHQFMHIKNGDALNGQYVKTINGKYVLRETELTNQEKQEQEEKADTDAAKFYPELQVAKHLKRFFKDCIKKTEFIELEENFYTNDFGFAKKNISFFDRLRALYPVEKYRPESTPIPEYYDPYKNDF